MEDRLKALESRIETLTATVVHLEQRVLTLENPAIENDRAADSAAVRTQAMVVEPVGNLGAQRPDLVATLGMVGLLFIAVGGGFLLRATTESGTLAPAAGVAAGLVYALGWVVVADRSATSRPWAALFHGLASALIGFPLVWEATTKFHVFTPAGAAGVLALLVLAPATVAWRRRCQSVAWVATVGACVTCLVLIAATSQTVPFAVVLIALGTATLWMGYSLDWVGLRWPVAALVDLVVSAITIKALSPQPTDSAGVTLAVQVLLVVSYLGSIGIRTLVKGRNVVPFEVVQTAGVLIVGFGGAIAVARSTGVSIGALGTLCLTMGLASYATASWFIDRRPALVRNTYFYTSVAIVFVLAGCQLLWATSVAVVVWTALAVLTCAVWTRTPQVFLVIHGAVYLCAAATITDLFGYGLMTMFGGASTTWTTPRWEHGALLAGAILAAWLSARGAGPTPRVVHIPRAAMILTLVWAAGSVLVGLVAPAVAGGPGGTLDAGVLATLRTSILSLAALVVAYIGRRQRFIEWSWLVYPLLVVVGLKMIAQDFSVSRPSTLFVALALYGVALIVAPRLRRSGMPTSG